MSDRENQQETASDGEIGWVAGIIDGEGSICLQINRRANRTQTLRVTPKVIVANTDSGIVERLAEILTKMGVGRYVMHSVPSNKGPLVKTATKPITYIHISGLKRVHKLLHLLEPWLAGEKKERCVRLKRFIDRRFEQAETLSMGPNYMYDEKDVDLMLSFMELTKSPSIEHIRRLLREYTQGAQYSKRAMMYSELSGNAKSSPETATAA